MIAAESFVIFLVAYAAVGVVFAIAFVSKGISQIDPIAKGSGAGFRLIILPGVSALWPLLLMRWISKKRGNK